MDAYLKSLVSSPLYTTIIMKKKRDSGEIEKDQKDTDKRYFCFTVYQPLLIIQYHNLFIQTYYIYMTS